METLALFFPFHIISIIAGSGTVFEYFDFESVHFSNTSVAYLM